MNNKLKVFWEKIKNLFRKKKFWKFVSVLVVSILSFSLIFSVGKSCFNTSKIVNYNETSLSVVENKYESLAVTGRTSTFDVNSIVSTNRYFSEVQFNVLGFNNVTTQDNSINNTITIGRKVTEYNVPFSMPQLLFSAKKELKAGNYKFTLSSACYETGCISAYDGTYMFSLTKSIPIGGGFRHTGIGAFYISSTGYNQSQVLGSKIITYLPANQGSGVIENNITVQLYSSSISCIDLGTFSCKKNEQVETQYGYNNSPVRNIMGSNNWKDSVIRQWLNSDCSELTYVSNRVSNWWSPATVFDICPDCCKIAGYLHGLDKEFLKSLKTVAVSTSFDSYDKSANSLSTYTTYDKVYLPDYTEALTSFYSTMRSDVSHSYFTRTPYSYGSCNVRCFGSDSSRQAKSTASVFALCCIGK